MAYRLFVMALLAVTLPTNAAAQRAATMMGVGGFSCGQYLAHRQSENESYSGNQTGVYATWVWGYISGYNHFSSRPPIEPPDENAVIAYLDKYCRNNPLSLVVSGAICLVADSGGYRPKYCKP